MLVVKLFNIISIGLKLVTHLLIQEDINEISQYMYTIAAIPYLAKNDTSPINVYI